MGTLPLSILSPAEVWEQVDPLAPNMAADPRVAGLAGLPYGQLAGPGFERLCYELLVFEGYSPRFFGRSGQRDYGVDIVVERGDKRTVYQCKNLAEVPAWTAVRDAAAKFEADWLGEAGLPRPDAFVYCCPHALDDRGFGEDWTRFHDEFKARTGVAISFWDKHAIDARLKRLPDLVAGLFSDSYAEHFCQREDWRDSPWTRVSWGTTGYASINRFLDYHRQARIHISPQDEEGFMDILSASPVVVIRGLPGSGKSLTGLELACRMSSPWRRIYYATLKDTPEQQHVWRSVGRRSSLPCLFLFDDCHLNLDLAGLVLERLNLERADRGGNVKLLLVLRDLPGRGAPDDTPGWLTRLEQDGHVVDMRTDLERTRAVTTHLRPEFAGLSRHRLEQIHHHCGGDLLLLDEHLRSVTSAQDLDSLNSAHLHAGIRDRYFGGHTRLPTVAKLACLAQFDLVPLASFLDADWNAGEKERAASLMTELSAPPRYQFLHASMAELVLRALMSLEVEPDQLDEQIIQSTGDALIAYLRHLPPAGAGSANLMTALTTLLRSRLQLLESAAEARIKARVLADEAIRVGVEAGLDRVSFGFLHGCLLIATMAANPVSDQYVELVVKRFRTLFRQQGKDIGGLATVGLGLYTLSKHCQAMLVAVQDEHGTEGFLRLIVANGTLMELLRILQCATPTFRQALLERLDEPTAAGLVDKTIAAGRSIGTLSIAMREIGLADPELLGGLERAIGAARFLRVIASNGTLIELFGIFSRATSTFRRALLDELDEPTAACLVDKTITAGRSIGTLNLTMRELGLADPELLGGLERAIGAARLLRVIAANGTLIELFNILQRATPTFRQALLDRLDEQTAARLVDKTIAAGRSIGSLSLIMRGIGLADQAVLGRLERAIGAARLLRVIAANGTLIDLFGILRVVTPNFREALLERLDEPTAAGLVDKTIAAGRSVESVHYTLRSLASAPALRKRLEQQIGIAGWWRLISSVGTLNSLSRIMQAMDEVFRGQFIAAAPRLPVADWQAIINRGTFQNACTFATGVLGALPRASRTSFGEALRQTASSLASSATWLDLNPSRPPEAPASAEGSILRDALRQRIDGIDPRNLEGLNFREAVNGLVFAWRERPDLRPTLAARLWQILPDPQEWSRGEGEIGVLRMVLTIARSEQIAKPEALRLLDTTATLLTPVVCAEIHTLPLFLLLWNLVALDYDRGSARRFGQTLPKALLLALMELLHERVKPKGPNKEKLAQFSLAGLLLLLDPSLRGRLSHLLEPIKGATRWLGDEALSQRVGFVPAVFALEGIALLRSNTTVFTPMVRSALLSKFHDYEDIGPAVEQLSARLTRS